MLSFQMTKQLRQSNGLWAKFTLHQFFFALLIFMDLDQLSIHTLKGASIVFALDLWQIFQHVLTCKIPGICQFFTTHRTRFVLGFDSFPAGVAKSMAFLAQVDGWVFNGIQAHWTLE